MKTTYSLTFWDRVNDPCETILQRDGVFAMLTWKDFNQPQTLGLSMPMMFSLFLVGAALPYVLLH